MFRSGKKGRREGKKREYVWWFIQHFIEFYYGLGTKVDKKKKKWWFRIAETHFLKEKLGLKKSQSNILSAMAEVKYNILLDHRGGSNQLWQGIEIGKVGEAAESR